MVKGHNPAPVESHRRAKIFDEKVYQTIREAGPLTVMQLAECLGDTGPRTRQQIMRACHRLRERALIQNACMVTGLNSIWVVWQ